MSGGDAIEQIMSVQPVPILVLAGGVRSGSETALASLGAGALEVLAKDTLDLRDPDGDDARAFRRRVKLLSRHPGAPPPARRPQPAAAGAGGARPPARGASVIVHLRLRGRPAGARRRARRASRPASRSRSSSSSTSPRASSPASREWLDDQVPLPVRLAEPGPDRRRASGSRPRARTCCSPRRPARARRAARRRAAPAVRRRAAAQRRDRAPARTASRSCSPAWAATARWGSARSGAPAGSRSRRTRPAPRCSACPRRRRSAGPSSILGPSRIGERLRALRPWRRRMTRALDRARRPRAPRDRHPARRPSASLPPGARSTGSKPARTPRRSRAAWPIRASGPRLLARLIEEVTVKETSFLRDHGQLASIDWPLPARARPRPRARARARVDRGVRDGRGGLQPRAAGERGVRRRAPAREHPRHRHLPGRPGPRARGQLPLALGARRSARRCARATSAPTATGWSWASGCASSSRSPATT